MACRNSKKGSGVFWNSQNLIVGKKVRWANCLGFILIAILYLATKVAVFLNFKLSRLALINTGIISGIWNVKPIFMAFLDRCLFRERLRCIHWVGVLCLIASALCIGLSGIS
mmetsp:Transcript_11549/g.19523  ORF Transcript_11549/g.19523 Transcript_11549/m.19523 type:complete len:112 (+) Transcript_11549:302-637(+)